MDDFFSKFKKAYLPSDIETNITAILKEKASVTNDDAKVILSSIDLTSLNTTDSADSIIAFIQRLNKLYESYPALPKVGAVCLFPVFSNLFSYLKVDGVGKAVVAAGFPSSQTFLDVKIAEVKKSVAFGANEIDVVISVGEFLEGNYEFVFEEIRQIKEACGKAKLKVILETGALVKEDEIWNASLVAMEAGADFIKTSTGKGYEGATLEAAYVMLQAIKVFHAESGKRVGIKLSGGISEIEAAHDYLVITKEILGDEWIKPEFFRIGASRLTNKVISKLLQKEDSYI